MVSNLLKWLVQAWFSLVLNTQVYVSFLSLYYLSKGEAQSRKCSGSIHGYSKSVTQRKGDFKKNLEGSGCGIVDIAVAFNTRGPRFETSHRQPLLNNYFCYCLSKRRKWKSRGQKWPIFKKSIWISSPRYLRFSQIWCNKAFVLPTMTTPITLNLGAAVWPYLNGPPPATSPSSSSSC